MCFAASILSYIAPSLKVGLKCVLKNVDNDCFIYEERTSIMSTREKCFVGMNKTLLCVMKLCYV